MKEGFRRPRPTRPRRSSVGSRSSARPSRCRWSSSAAPAQRHRTCSRSCLAPRPVRADPGRGPLPHRPGRLSRPARRRGDAGAVPRPPARVLVARLSDQPDARHVPVRRPRALRRRGRALRGRPRRRPRGARAGPVLRPALVSAPAKAEGAAWSSRAPTTSPRRRPCTASFPRRASSTSSATGATPRPRGSRRPAA